MTNTDPQFAPQETPGQESSRRFRSYITWGPREILIGICAALVLVFVITSVIVLPVREAYGDNTPEVFFASAVSTLLWNVSYVLAAYLLVRSTGGSWASLGLRRAWTIAGDVFESIRNRARTFMLVRPPRLLVAIVAGYLLCYGALVVYNIFIVIFGFDFLEPAQQLPDDIFDTTAVIVITGLAVMIAAPIAEEIFFRGFLYGGLRRYLPLCPAALLSGFIFSTAHVNLGLILPFTLIGVVLAYVYERSGNLAAPIGVHFIFNSISFIVLVFVPELR